MSEVRRVKKLTNAEFYKVADCLRNHREQIERECDSKLAVAVFIKQKLDIDASPANVENVLETVGISLVKRSKTGGSTKVQNTRDKRIIVRSIVTLYKKLGEEVPSELQELLNRVSGAKADAPSNGVPVSSVPSTRNISVVN